MAHFSLYNTSKNKVVLNKLCMDYGRFWNSCGLWELPTDSSGKSKMDSYE